jgi:hypothetical protein
VNFFYGIEIFVNFWFGDPGFRENAFPCQTSKPAATQNYGSQIFSTKIAMPLMTFSEMVSSVFYNALGKLLAVMTIFLIVSIKRKISSWRYPVRTWTLDSLHEVSSGQSVREPPVPRRSFSSLVSNPWMKFASHGLFELLSLICLGFRSLFSFFVNYLKIDGL